MSLANVVEPAGGELHTAIDSLRARAHADDSPSYSERLAILDALSDALLARDPEVSRVLPAAGIAFAAAFLRSTNLQHLVRRELANEAALSGFVRIDDRKSLRVLPRGVACHWIAGNVPLLGLFSWALSAVLGNVNVVRLSSRSDDFLSPILRLLAATSPGGKVLARETLVVQFPRDDEQSHRVMSAAADVRVAWGGREAVEAVMALPARWDCETVVLGPRMSIAVVDPAQTSVRTLGRLASDVAYFDQQACSSPQWVFVKRPQQGDVFDRAVQEFADAFAVQARTLGRHALDHGETYRIELDRARVLLDGGNLHRDQQTAWTVAVLDEPDPRLACANRFVQLVPFREVEDIIRWIPSNVQTAVTLLDDDDLARFSELAARRGVCRFPRPGEGNHFESPWDGIPLVSRLTRWSIRTQPPGTA
jgi:acyl-CoA reductase-like NAD-dependent aldehyde dehydrogenase